jgi:hypothetical protein
MGEHAGPAAGFFRHKSIYLFGVNGRLNENKSINQSNYAVGGKLWLSKL